MGYIKRLSAVVIFLAALPSLVGCRDMDRVGRFLLSVTASRHDAVTPGIELARIEGESSPQTPPGVVLEVTARDMRWDGRWLGELTGDLWRQTMQELRRELEHRSVTNLVLVIDAQTPASLADRVLRVVARSGRLGKVWMLFKASRSSPPQVAMAPPDPALLREVMAKAPALVRPYILARMDDSVLFCPGSGDALAALLLAPEDRICDLWSQELARMADRFWCVARWDALLTLTHALCVPTEAPLAYEVRRWCYDQSPGDSCPCVAYEQKETFGQVAETLASDWRRDLPFCLESKEARDTRLQKSGDDQGRQDARDKVMQWLKQRPKQGKDTGTIQGGKLYRNILKSMK